MISKIYFYIIKAISDLFFPLIYRINDKNNDFMLNYYYFVFNRKELLSGGSYKYKFDDKGIPIIKGHISDTDGGYFYHPQAIGQYSLAVYHDFLQSEDDADLKKFLQLANWFKNNYKLNKGIPYWESTENTVHKVYGEDQNGQVISSMSQSRAISVLLRAFQETSDSVYLELAERAMLAYEKTPDEGGFLDVNTQGELFFEEASQPRILNHLIFSLFGLYDYCRIKRFKTKYTELFNRAVISIKNHIHEYDTGWWSLYDNYYLKGIRRINPSTRHYHNIHIQQLKVLYNITGVKVFEQYYKKWLEYDKSFIKRLKMLCYKIKTVKQMGRI